MRRVWIRRLAARKQSLFAEALAHAGVHAIADAARVTTDQVADLLDARRSEQRRGDARAPPARTVATRGRRSGLL